MYKAAKTLCKTAVIK